MKWAIKIIADKTLKPANCICGSEYGHVLSCPRSYLQLSIREQKFIDMWNKAFFGGILP